MNIRSKKKVFLATNINKQRLLCDEKKQKQKMLHFQLHHKLPYCSYKKNSSAQDGRQSWVKLKISVKLIQNVRSYSSSPSFSHSFFFILLLLSHLMASMQSKETPRWRFNSLAQMKVPTLSTFIHQLWVYSSITFSLLCLFVQFLAYSSFMVV